MAVLACLYSAQVLSAANDDPLVTMVVVDQAEWRDSSADPAFAWDVSGWIGKDLVKLGFSTEGEHVDGRVEQADIEIQVMRAVSPFWNMYAGVQRDLRPRPDRNWFSIGVQGLAPGFIDIDAAAYFTDEGRVAARVEIEYELLVTQRLVLVPEIEINVYGQSDVSRAIGAGVSDIEGGLRLRYQVRREFAPYVGLNWSRKTGNTADLARAVGDDVREFGLVLGFHAWF